MSPGLQLISEVLPPQMKKPNYLSPKQFGYLVRPVTFSPCLAKGLAFS